ncbi:Major Facilitator Superfamily protein [Haloechinothrix alba]|uniref:Major Facilitator Superfamily protein n=1 Tax=Haloechinothrix alba TaxID=664784 RepID=A0A238VPH8_9PSEU|nr:MFS transporter [Haloechinothrix alba]SNR36126.1 Major Facilitator Superfamily protein [Haloechinothrix alba]
MIATLRRVRSRWFRLAELGELPGVVRLLVISQLVFNIGFYLVVPYLFGHMAGDLALAGWMVGLVLGLRTFSQQGLFFLGGALADRFGPKPMVLLGCALRVLGFLLLGQAGSAPGIVVGALLTGVAAALFSPAVEALLAREAGALDRSGGARRSDVFALFAVAGELGAVVGPMLGALLLLADFTVVCTVAAGIFVAVALAHLRWLPGHGGAHDPEPILFGWRSVLANGTFLVFAAGYAGYLVSYNQLYLALPAELRRATGSEAALGWLFALSSVMVVAGQLPATAWARRRLGSDRGMVVGLLGMAAGFLVVAVVAFFPPAAGPVAVVPAIAMVVLLTLGQMLAVPFAKDVVARLAAERRLGTYFGLVHSVGGAAVLAGSTVTGALLDVSDSPGLGSASAWIVLTAVPLAGAAAMGVLARRGALSPAHRTASADGGDG